jgi:hypothetical protein
MLTEARSTERVRIAGPYRRHSDALRDDQQRRPSRRPLSGVQRYAVNVDAQSRPEVCDRQHLVVSKVDAPFATCPLIVDPKADRRRFRVCFARLLGKRTHGARHRLQAV